MPTKRIFISYKRNSQPDEPLALTILNALQGEYDVFVDQRMPIGTVWGTRIQQELEKSDALITLLSPASILSEMVIGELDTAFNLFKASGRPRTLPVRLRYKTPFAYPLSAYLNHVNWASWDSDDDTDALVRDLRAALNGHDLPLGAPQRDALLRHDQQTSDLLPPHPAANLELTDTAMDHRSPYYLERDEDRRAMEVVRGNRRGITLSIVGPHQVGKSTLLRRVVEAAKDHGTPKKVVFLDFKLLDKSTFQSPDDFFRQFSYWLTEELGAEDKTAAFWSKPISNSVRCTRYVSTHLLQTTTEPVLLAIDELETAEEAPFSSDFYGMLRAWHEGRSRWQNPLDLALVTSTEPYRLIKSRQSPFNVGHVCNLAEFTPQQIQELAHRYDDAITNSEVSQLILLIGGHPYLVRRALHLVASCQMSVREIFARASDPDGPFGDHLRHHLFSLRSQQPLIATLHRVLSKKRPDDEESVHRLVGAGILRRQGAAVFPRCAIYGDFFRAQLGC